MTLHPTSCTTAAIAALRDPFQARVQPWMMACFGSTISADRIERNHRFIEEALELVQANGCTADEAHQLVDYVYGRPVGDVFQEIGGVMVTLAALCLASSMDMHQAAETELARVWTKVAQIRAKQAAKPKHSPLPAAPSEPTTADIAEAHAHRVVAAGEMVAELVAALRRLHCEAGYLCMQLAARGLPGHEGDTVDQVMSTAAAVLAKAEVSDGERLAHESIVAAIARAEGPTP